MTYGSNTTCYPWLKQSFDQCYYYRFFVNFNWILKSSYKLYIIIWSKKVYMVESEICQALSYYIKTEKKPQTSISSKLTFTRGVSMTSARKSHMNVRANVSTDVATNHSEIVDTKYTSGTVVCKRGWHCVYNCTTYILKSAF